MTASMSRHLDGKRKVAVHVNLSHLVTNNPCSGGYMGDMVFNGGEP